MKKQMKMSGFTSHYVPIKSMIVNSEVQYGQNFTSHYVPIKSPHDTNTAVFRVFLYIPLCSY